MEKQQSPDLPQPAGLPQQRERAISMLSESFAHNFLELEEFERRIEVAQAARTVKELAALIEDLPAEVSEPASSPPALPQGEQEILGLLSTRRFSGKWLNRRTVSARGLMCSMILDYRDLELPPGETELKLKTLMSEVSIRVPPDLRVELDVMPVMAEIREKGPVRHDAEPRQSSSRQSVLRISGLIIMSELVVRAK
jgi:hypothetical protein